MRNVLAILACLLLLLLSLGTKLFQSVPIGHESYLEQVLSSENAMVNLAVVVIVVFVFVVLYLVRYLFVCCTRQRKRKMKPIEELLIVVTGCLIVGFSMVLGLLKDLPILKDSVIANCFSDDRIFLNSIIVVSTTTLAALTFWVGKTRVKLDDKDESE